LLRSETKAQQTTNYDFQMTLGFGLLLCFIGTLSAAFAREFWQTFLARVGSDFYHTVLESR
jgi:predicted MFS family arabinose efflux permease